MIPKNLPASVRAELREVYADPRRFTRLLKVWDKATKSYVPFVPNAEQEKLLDALQEHKRIVVLKPRQVGISTLLRAWAFWQVFTATNPVRWGVLSFTRPSSEVLMRMDRGFLDSLPQALTTSRKLKVDKISSIEFGDSKASTSSFTASSRYGTRSYALSDAHISEFAFYENPEELLATVTATVGNGQVVIESTPNAPNDAYHRLVQGAVDGSNGWHLVSFWWHEHEDYRSHPPVDFTPTEEEQREALKYGLDDAQLYWRRQQVQTIGLAKFRREYPACMTDAFHYGEGGYFSAVEMESIQELRFATPEMAVDAPRSDDVYVVGVDTGGGTGGDYSAITAVSASTRQVVYQWRSNTVSPAELASEVVRVASRYNQARVLVESNNHGHVTLLRLRDLGYLNLWKSAQGKDWVTTAQSKIAAYESLREYVGNGLVQFLPDVTLMELRSLRSDGLAPSAPDGLHDDLAMSLALAYYALRSVPQSHIISARQSRVDAALMRIRTHKIQNNPMPWRVNG